MIEVLATLMLAAIVLPAIMRGMSVCMATSSQARRQAEAAALAQDKLSELVALGQLQQAVQSGDWGADWPGYRWEAHVDQFDGATLLQVDVTAFWQSGTGGKGAAERSVTLTTLVYNSSSSSTGSTTGSGTGTGTSSGTGSGTGAKTGSGTGSGAGARTGAKS
jgi:Tfp pilus assembly protein PilV